MYKSYDFRCLKPTTGVSSVKWPHYEMSGYRAAKTVEELSEVEEIPFDKYFFNFEDPQVLNVMSNGKKRYKRCKRKPKKSLFLYKIVI